VFGDLGPNGAGKTTSLRLLAGMLRPASARAHVLSEVQRVADRVGVLRLGRLVAVERLDELRSKSLHHVQAQLGEPIALEAFSDLPGLVDLSISDRSMTCSAPRRLSTSS